MVRSRIPASRQRRAEPTKPEKISLGSQAGRPFHLVDGLQQARQRAVTPRQVIRASRVRRTRRSRAATTSRARPIRRSLTGITRRTPLTRLASRAKRTRRSPTAKTRPGTPAQTNPRKAANRATPPRTRPAAERQIALRLPGNPGDSSANKPGANDATGDPQRAPKPGDDARILRNPGPTRPAARRPSLKNTTGDQRRTARPFTKPGPAAGAERPGGRHEHPGPQAGVSGVKPNQDNSQNPSSPSGPKGDPAQQPQSDPRTNNAPGQSQAPRGQNGGERPKARIPRPDRSRARIQSPPTRATNPPAVSGRVGPEQPDPAAGR